MGYTGVELANGVQILRGGGIVVGTNGTTELANITFAAQNLGSSSSFDLVVKVLLGDGSTVSSPAQTITIPSGAVKTNLITPANPTVNSFTTTTIGYGLGANLSYLSGLWLDIESSVCYDFQGYGFFQEHDTFIRRPMLIHLCKSIYNNLKDNDKIKFLEDINFDLSYPYSNSSPPSPEIATLYSSDIALEIT